MPPVLSALSYLLDFKLGPENVTSDMVFKNAYVDARTAEPLSVLVVGTVAATVDLSGGVYMIVLETPPLSSPVLRAMFEEQTQVLDNVLIADRLDMARVNELVPTSLHNVIPSQLVIHRQHWSQGPSDSSAGVVYVTVTRDTRFTRNDFSVERAMFPFVGVAREVPVGDPESAMEPGALMVFDVALARVDAPVQEHLIAESSSLYARAYLLNAMRAIRFLRSNAMDM